MIWIVGLHGPHYKSEKTGTCQCIEFDSELARVLHKTEQGLFDVR
jgi:hypothetical protein